MFYFAPDTLEWESLERGHTEWVRFLLDGDVRGFYGDDWTTHRAAAADVGPAEGLHVVPPPWARHDGERSVRPVPIAELWYLARKVGPQLHGLPDGTWVRHR